LFDLAGVDVVAAGDDQLAGAPGDGEVAVGAAPAEVAGVEPAISVERLGGRLGELPVALEDVRSPHLDLAGLFVVDGLAGGDVDDARLLAGERLAHGAGAALAIVGVGQVHDRL